MKSWGPSPNAFKVERYTLYAIRDTRFAIRYTLYAIRNTPHGVRGVRDVRGVPEDRASPITIVGLAAPVKRAVPITIVGRNHFPIMIVGLAAPVKRAVPIMISTVSA